MRERDKAIMRAAGPQMAIDHMRRETDEVQATLDVAIALSGDDPELLAAYEETQVALAKASEGLDEWEEKLNER